MARVVDITRGGNDKMALLVVKIHALNILAKLERTHATGGPTEVVRKLLTGNGPVLGGQKTVEFLMLHQIVKKAVRVSRGDCADQVF
ncbi:hypothetical protein DJ55_4171 [Yersinia pseudotuberculosis]|nr:hypothetical protein DJ55_4171 [Yersinia pseudotuberculosis]